MLKRLSEHVMCRRAAGVAALALTLVMVAVPAVWPRSSPKRPASIAPAAR